MPTDNIIATWVRNLSFLIIDTYYPQVLTEFYSRLGERVNRMSYSQIKRELLNLRFGTSDYYSRNLRKLGHEAEEVIINDERFFRGSIIPNKYVGVVPAVLVNSVNQWNMFKQVERLVVSRKPDVWYVQNISLLWESNLRKLKRHCRLIVGQIAAPLPPRIFLEGYDLILTSLPHFVSRINNLGVNSEYLKIGFEVSLLNEFKPTERKYDVVFIGGFTPHHSSGNEVLEEVSKRIKIDYWGYGTEHLNPRSEIIKSYHGPSWGRNMYKILNQAKICVNRHIDIADGYANNMRLYEATGMGALLVTDNKMNITELFAPGKEIIVYDNSADLVSKIEYYLRHPREREKIAAAGQRRTLKDHNYEVRMREMTAIVKKYL